MIHSNRARGTSVAAFTLLTAALLLAFLAGCASDKPAPAPAAPVAPPPPPPATLSQIKTELLSTKAQLQLTNESLNTLQKSSAADAQGNFDKFTEQYIKLQASADAVSKQSEELKKKSTEYFAMWNRQVDVQNPDLRAQAVQQRADAETIHNTLTSEMELARITFKPYMANLKDIGNYLRGNLNPATLTSVGELVKKSDTQAKEVDGHIAAIVSAIDKIAAATGAK